MSLINFLNPKLKPSVESDAICEEGYSANNLIAVAKEEISRGFMAFSVTKPPVDIIFEFPKAFDLKIIKLWNTHGSLRSTAFEIHGKCDGMWKRVAYVRELSQNVDSVAFCHQSEYNSRTDVNTGNLQHCEMVFFFKTAHNVLTNTNRLKITIRRTHKCPPVLRKVEVWGLPSLSLDKADCELVKTSWNEINNPLDNQNSTTRCKYLPPHNVSELNVLSTLNIPEEFLDAITWELMIFPTVLPSGKVVDQSTIVKHSEVEAKWGRLPSDPFTGLEFTSQRKPILNLSLKARLEKFLAEHADNFKTVPRSLGSARMRFSETPHLSKYGMQLTSCLSGTVSKLAANSTSATYTSFASSVQQLSTLPIAKRPKLSTDSSKYFISQEMKFDEPSEYPYSITTQTASVGFNLGSITSIMNFSINSAVKNALQNVTRFTCMAEESKSDTCICCKSLALTYEIKTCKHLICRGCLLQLIKDQMCTCKTSFRRVDVERYHKF